MDGSIGGAVGFALVFNCRGKILVFAGLGAAISWFSYLFVFNYTDGNYFTATLAAACIAGIYANIIGLAIRTPPTVFLTMSIFPLLPGSNLYLTVYAIIVDNWYDYHDNGRKVFLICIAIALGHIIVEVIVKYVRMFLQRQRGITE